MLHILVPVTSVRGSILQTYTRAFWGLVYAGVFLKLTLLYHELGGHFFIFLLGLGWRTSLVGGAGRTWWCTYCKFIWLVDTTLRGLGRGWTNVKHVYLLSGTLGEVRNMAAATLARTAGSMTLGSTLVPKDVNTSKTSKQKWE